LYNAIKKLSSNKDEAVYLV